MLSQILSSSPVLVEHMAEYLGISLTRGDHFRGLMLHDKLSRFLGRREWLLLQVRQLSEPERGQYRQALHRLLLDLSPPPLGDAFSHRLLELGLAFRSDSFDRPLMPLEFAFLSDAAWTLQGSLAQAMVSYMAQGVIPRQSVRESTSYVRALQALATAYYQVRQSWASQIPALSLRQLLTMETLQGSPSPQPAARLASLLGTGSPEVFSWPRYMRYHGTGSHNPLQEILLLGLARPKDLDPSSALRELAVSLEAEKPLARALPRLFKRFSRPGRSGKDAALVRVAPPGDFGLDLQRLLVASLMLPPPATKDDTPSMIHVDRLSRLLGLPQAYQRFLLAVAWDCGWLHVTGDDPPLILPAPAAEELMVQGPTALQQAAGARLAALPSWDESRPFPCRLGSPGPMTHLIGRLRGYLVELTGTLRTWAPVSSLSGLLVGLPGFRRLLATAPDLAPVTEILDAPQRAPSPLLTGLATTIWWSRQAEMARDQANTLYIRALHPTPATAPIPAATLPLRVAANGEFFLPLTLPLERLRRASEFADILAVDQACRFRVTRSSLVRAKNGELTARDIGGFLACDMPQNIVHLIEETFPPQTK
ncbi:MAG: hypothetical protein MUE60_07975 [Candidatus Eisenbacteria bacterium]|nr:hypothetical protein [Candidatus Eisenbacteria bacterium]